MCNFSIEYILNEMWKCNVGLLNHLVCVFFGAISDVYVGVVIWGARKKLIFMFFHVNIFAWLLLLLLCFLLFLCIINDFECKRYFSSSCGFDGCVLVYTFLFCIRDSLLLLCMIREKNVNGVQVFKKLCRHRQRRKNVKNMKIIYIKKIV